MEQESLPARAAAAYHAHQSMRAAAASIGLPLSSYRRLLVQAGITPRRAGRRPEGATTRRAISLSLSHDAMVLLTDQAAASGRPASRIVEELIRRGLPSAVE